MNQFNVAFLSGQVNSYSSATIVHSFPKYQEHEINPTLISFSLLLRTPWAALK